MLLGHIYFTKDKVTGVLTDLDRMKINQSLLY